MDNLHISDVGEEFGKLFRKVHAPDRLHGPRHLFWHLHRHPSPRIMKTGPPVPPPRHVPELITNGLPADVATPMAARDADRSTARARQRGLRPRSGSIPSGWHSGGTPRPFRGGAVRH